MTLASTAAAYPLLGYTEDFPGAGGTAGWVSGAALTNPGTGGVGGASDGFLQVQTLSAFHLGCNSSSSPFFAGDYIAAGVTRIKLWLNDVGTDDPLEIHLQIGNNTNFWQKNAAMLPPLHQWAEFVVPLDGPAGWTHTINTGTTWTQALQTADRIHIRHDLAPYAQTPDNLKGDFGIDRVTLANDNVDVGDPPASVVRPLELAVPYPNPSRGPVTFSMTQFRPGEVRIEIVDVTGRRIRSLVLPESGAGPRTWMWDGRDDRGQKAPPGAYRVRARTDDGGMSQPLVRIE